MTCPFGGGFVVSGRLLIHYITRGRSRIEPEAVFRQMKYNMAYKRFCHFGIDKVKMNCPFVALAFLVPFPSPQTAKNIYSCF